MPRLRRKRESFESHLVAEVLEDQSLLSAGAALGTARQAFSTAGLSESMFFKNSTMFQICTSDNETPKAGMPVIRMPWLTCQKTAPSSSSSTP